MTPSMEILTAGLGVAGAVAAGAAAVAMPRFFRSGTPASQLARCVRASAIVLVLLTLAAALLTALAWNSGAPPRELWSTLSLVVCVMNGVVLYLFASAARRALLLPDAGRPVDAAAILASHRRLVLLRLEFALIGCGFLVTLVATRG